MQHIIHAASTCPGRKQFLESVTAMEHARHGDPALTFYCVGLGNAIIPNMRSRLISTSYLWCRVNSVSPKAPLGSAGTEVLRTRLEAVCFFHCE